MHRPFAKNIVRLGLFASAIAAIACSNPTAPTSPNVAGKKAARDTILGDTTGVCRSGWNVVNGKWTCADEM